MKRLSINKHTTQSEFCKATKALVHDAILAAYNAVKNSDRNCDIQHLQNYCELYVTEKSIALRIELSHYGLKSHVHTIVRTSHKEASCKVLHMLQLKAKLPIHTYYF